MGTRVGLDSRHGGLGIESRIVGLGLGLNSRHGGLGIESTRTTYGTFKQLNDLFKSIYIKFAIHKDSYILK